MPGLKTAQGYYEKLASGDPKAINTAVAPAEQGIKQQTDAVVRNIDQTAPAGGVKDLAKEEAKISGAGQIGNLITQSYTSAFPALAQLGTGGTGLSINEVTQALQGFQGSASTTGAVASEQAAGKAAQLSFFGALAGAAGTAAGGMCWIAEALWSPMDMRTAMTRLWLNTVYANDPVGRYVVAAYRKWGRKVAKAVSRYPVLRMVFRPIFEKALVCARRDLKVAYGCTATAA